MKASILAITISSLLTAQATAATKVDVELANQHTYQLIEDQMSAIDVSVQQRLNAQYSNADVGTTVSHDDVHYEKQTNGTWAIIGGASATLVAGLLSTSSSSNGFDDDPELPSLPIHPVPDNELPPIADRPIEDVPNGNEKNHVQIAQNPDSSQTDNRLYVNGNDVGGVSIEGGEVVLDYDTKERRANFEVIQGDDDGTYVRISEGAANGPLIHINKDGVVSIADDSQLGKPTLPIDDVPNGNEKNHVQIAQNPESSQTDNRLYVNGNDVGGVSIEGGEVVLDYDTKERRANFEVIQGDDDGTYVRISEGAANGPLIHINKDGVVSIADDSQLGKPTLPIDDVPNGNEKNHVQIAQNPDSSQTDNRLYVNGNDVGGVSIEGGEVVLDYDTKERRANFEVIDNDTQGGKVVRVSDDSTERSKFVHISSEGVITPIDRNNMKSQLKSLDRSKLHSIDSSNLKKAKSAIQKRVRG